MVHMMPDFLADDIQSNAERKLFEMFKNTETEEEIYILHSLAMAEHTTNVFGEVDFVIICSQGILAVEVKGGNIGYENNYWTFTNRYGKTDIKKKGPFKQASDNMFALKDYIEKHFSRDHEIKYAQSACCVIMPDCRFTYRGTEVNENLLFDATRTWDLNKIISESFTWCRNTLEDIKHFQGGYLSNEAAKRLAIGMRGSFCLVPPLSETLSGVDKSLLLLTEDQYERLMDMDDNDRMLISGAAGTGKTLLALEACRRKTIAGLKVLYVCFNTYMAQSVRRHISDESVTFDVFTLHALMVKLCGDRSGNEKNAAYFRKLVSRFVSTETENRYDLIVVDEGQDLIRPDYLECLDHLVKGGLTEGKWIFFFDPNQNIFGDHNEYDLAMEKLHRQASITNLTVNCRNTKQIAVLNHLYTKLEKSGRCRIDGPKPEVIPYTSFEEELNILGKILQDLKDEGLSPRDIVILSPYPLSSPNACLSVGMIPGKLGYTRTMNVWDSTKNDYRYAPVTQFKGLEARVIIYVDVDAFLDEKRRMMNYIAMSRARTKLYVLYDKSHDAERIEMLSSYND